MGRRTLLVLRRTKITSLGRFDNGRSYPMNRMQFEGHKNSKALMELDAHLFDFFWWCMVHSWRQKWLRWEILLQTRPPINFIRSPVVWFTNGWKADARSYFFRLTGCGIASRINIQEVTIACLIESSNIWKFLLHQSAYLASIKFVSFNRREDRIHTQSHPIIKTGGKSEETKSFRKEWKLI